MATGRKQTPGCKTVTPLELKPEKYKKKNETKCLEIK